MTFDVVTLVSLAVLIPSIAVHEYAHGYAAFRLGDTTAKLAGRLSLNPLRHLDPFGTVVLPLLLWAGGGPIFGYAKPVPVNPRASKADIRTFELVTGFAGPAANLGLAVVGGLAVRLTDTLVVTWGPLAEVVWVFGFSLAKINLVLMFFNLIPIPPLDGASVVPLFLPDRALRGYYSMQRYSFAILLALLWIVPAVLNVYPLGWYFRYTVVPMMRLLTGVSLA